MALFGLSRLCVDLKGPCVGLTRHCVGVKEPFFCLKGPAAVQRKKVSAFDNTSELPFFLWTAALCCPDRALYRPERTLVGLRGTFIGMREPKALCEGLFGLGMPGLGLRRPCDLGDHCVGLGYPCVSLREPCVSLGGPCVV